MQLIGQLVSQSVSWSVSQSVSQSASYIIFSQNSVTRELLL